MSKFQLYLEALTESTDEEATAILSKYGKVSSKETDGGKSIRLTVDLGSDEEAAIKDINDIEKSTGRANTHLLSNGKSYSAEVILTNKNYKAPVKKELSAADKQRWAMYGGDPDKNPRGLGS